jgi:alkyl hydroperoxide reductase subunit AhpC
MVNIGILAPRFSGTALVRGNLQRLRWRDIHQGKTLLLLFDAHAARAGTDLPVLNQAAVRLRSLHANLAVVCRPPLGETTAWATERIAQLSWPLILDPEDDLASRYDLVDPDGKAFWGQFIIDSSGIVRQSEVCGCHLPADVEEMVRFVQAVAPSLNKSFTRSVACQPF